MTINEGTHKKFRVLLQDLIFEVRLPGVIHMAGGFDGRA
jgi:hypothetical protein